MPSHLQISSYRIDLMSVKDPISPKQCHYEMEYSVCSFYWLDSLEIWLDHNSTYHRSLLLNKANLRDLIAATSLVIFLKLSIIRPCDLEIWWMTPTMNKVRFLYNIKLCVSFHIHQWIQTGVTVRKRPIWVKLDDFFSCVILQFDLWP